MHVNLRKIHEAAAHDPAAALMAAVGDVAAIEPFHNIVLVATYIAPAKTMKGPNGEDITFHRPDGNLAEDRYQGKVGLVIKTGPLAFQDDSIAKFGGVTVKPGDWVIYRASDALEFGFKDRRTTNDAVPLRWIEDSLIKGRIADPALIY